ncbi:MAG: hypothetical protein LBN25_01485, partial [Christensenellaceae bacterium]|nr:hypothetical protein [Christensenellaceae bacterium]
QEYSPRAEEKTAAVLDEIKTTLDALRSGHDKLGRIQQVFTETMRAGATAQADVAKTKAAFDIDKQEGYNIKFKDKIEQKAALEAKIKAIHPQLLQRFNDIKREIKQKKALCSKPVNKYSSSGFCGGCGHEVKNQVNAKITEHGIAECPNCRCLLYTE